MHTETSSLIFIKYLTTVFDNVGQSVLLISIEPDNRFKVLMVNKFFGKTSGFLNEAAGKYVDEIVPETIYDQITTRYQEAVQTKETVVYREWLQTPKGWRMYDAKIIPILNSVGECTQFVVLARDITDEYNTSQERSAAIALNRYMVGQTRAFVVMGKDFTILRRLNVPAVLDTWEYGESIKKYLSTEDFVRFKELSKHADDTERGRFIVNKLSENSDKQSFSYTLFYNAELERLLMNISLQSDVR